MNEPATRPATFLFADLAGFTALTEAHGDEQAADLVDLLCAGLARALPRFGGEHVKTIGDAVMVRLGQPAPGVLLGLHLVDGILGRDGWPAGRVGLHHGPAVERHGDYIGATVNLAARLTTLARPGQLLLTSAAAQLAGHMAEVALKPQGRHRLRNVREPVDVVAAVSTGRREEEAALDPVCRMAVVRRTGRQVRHHGGVEHWFCSAGCAALFDAAPGAYVGPAGAAADRAT